MVKRSKLPEESTFRDPSNRSPPSPEDLAAVEDDAAGAASEQEHFKIKEAKSCQEEMGQDPEAAQKEHETAEAEAAGELPGKA
jgi:hypothetical protein